MSERGPLHGRAATGPTQQLFGVSDVIGSTCELKSVTKQGDAYAFEASYSEGNGASAHSWRVRSGIHVEGTDSFTFDGKTYRFCSADDGGRTGSLARQADEHLPLTAGSYRTGAGRCGGLVYWDNPKTDLDGMFGGSNFGGDTCDVKRAVARGTTVSFASTCIPTRDGASMRISVPTTISVNSPTEFRYAGKAYRLCKKITY
ncbi:hypothetical protein [Lichenifustis flavocetrariae]|uniref:Uncharacterized protein n=1 Tax=Lichenifustis flavocetrariae TaxID=2949735 RepID=A0AA42CRS2_9HYPH|nr:hypothetical protein [Lichenifustis flavocetrariae]MCW6512782.1 hypothetical protein [Lichenifustis flavocetrariae]